MRSPSAVLSGDVLGVEKSRLLQRGYSQPVVLEFIGGEVVKASSYFPSKEFKCWQ